MLRFSFLIFSSAGLCETRALPSVQSITFYYEKENKKEQKPGSNSLCSTTQIVPAELKASRVELKAFSRVFTMPVQLCCSQPSVTLNVELLIAESHFCLLIFWSRTGCMLPSKEN